MLLCPKASPPLPDEILQAKHDKRCPRCNRGRDNGFELAFNTEYDDEGIGGDIGYCHNCRFAF